MYIAILTHGVSPFGHVYAKAFEAHGHVAEVFPLSAYQPEEGERVRVIGSPEFNPLQTRVRLVPHLKMLGRVRRAIREFQLDIVFAIYLSSAGLLACLSGHPRVGCYVWE